MVTASKRSTNLKKPDVSLTVNRCRSLMGDDRRKSGRQETRGGDTGNTRGQDTWTDEDEDGISKTQL